MPDYIDFKTMAGFTLEMVLVEIDAAITVACKHGGAIFGGYVRDVLVPRKFNPTCPVQFKDVDIWFSNTTHRDAFIKEMGGRLQIADRNNGHSNGPESKKLYEFERQQYHLFSHDTCVAWLDIITSVDFPVNDFDVNRVTYRKIDGVGCFEGYRGPTQHLLHRILLKHARLLPAYWAILYNENKPSPKQQLHIRRVIRRYVKRGWTITFGGNQYREDQDFTDWIRDHIQTYAFAKATAEARFAKDTAQVAEAGGDVKAAAEANAKTTFDAICLRAATIAKTLTMTEEEIQRQMAIDAFDAQLAAMRVSFITALDL